MSTSPEAISGRNCVITVSTAAAGTMIHTARGGVSWAISSAGEDAARAPTAAAACTAAVDLSYATHS